MEVLTAKASKVWKTNASQHLTRMVGSLIYKGSKARSPLMRALKLEKRARIIRFPWLTQFLARAIINSINEAKWLEIRGQKEESVEINRFLFLVNKTLITLQEKYMISKTDSVLKKQPSSPRKNLLGAPPRPPVISLLTHHVDLHAWKNYYGIWRSPHLEETRILWGVWEAKPPMKFCDLSFDKKIFFQNGVHNPWELVEMTSVSTPPVVC